MQVLPRLLEESQPFARRKDSLRDPSLANALRMREAAAFRISVDPGHDASHDLEAATVDLLVGAHV